MRLSPRFAIAATLLAFVSACSSGTPSQTIAADPALAGVAINPALTHIHALTINTDGELLAGTHEGLFAINATGRSSHVGRSNDDLMGLAGISGTKTLYASGHPGSANPGADPLGLIVSTDGGQTWAPKSREGQSDFHALGAAGTLVLGFDGTNILVSDDSGATWTTGAKLDVTSLAVFEPSIFAATGDGVKVSSDNGKTFDAIEGAPKMRLLSAATDGSVWGVDVEGYAWRTQDGQNWEKSALVGSVDGIVGVSFDLAYAVTPSKMYTLY
ncbi:F510_1955 family glycosylhydrolase [Smaragdicoccus niigatensis]|uniref:F510_1955 family glycosylhydrolase n=1 Tax=Smaragdicoccus niigatensis TaxID=359359 RepID=UPI000369375E|nr:sialidase family protein [Smaragdicoccus niigatensis]